jgi:16S rRNA (guanine966-N2)-methyltransferase
VEKDPAKFRVLLGNFSALEERIECKSMPVERFILRNRIGYSVVFCDPPFPYKYRLQLLESLADGATAAPGGLVLMHYPREDALPGSIRSLALEDEREYGRSIVRFYRKKPPILEELAIPGKAD